MGKNNGLAKSIGEFIDSRVIDIEMHVLNFREEAYRTGLNDGLSFREKLLEI